MPIAIKNSTIDISLEDTTKELAKSFSNYLTGGEVIFLYGEMGVGKTTFVKYLINQLQIKKKLQITEVTSPTFNLLNEYPLLFKAIKLFGSCSKIISYFSIDCRNFFLRNNSFPSSISIMINAVGTM